jgi:hypothetical protein
LDVAAGFAALSLALASTPARAQVTFKGFGVIDAFVSDMSADRIVVVGGWVSSDKQQDSMPHEPSGRDAPAIPARAVLKTGLIRVSMKCESPAVV